MELSLTLVQVLGSTPVSLLVSMHSSCFNAPLPPASSGLVPSSSLCSSAIGGAAGGGFTDVDGLVAEPVGSRNTNCITTETERVYTYNFEL